MKHLLKKAFLLLALVGGASNAWADPVTIFDAAAAGWAAGGVDLTTGTTTVGDVTWNGGGSASIASGSATIDGVSWTSRLKFGGKSTFKSGSTLARVLTFTPSVAGTVKVYGVHGSDSGTRTFYISQSITSTDRDVSTALGSYACTAENKSGVATAVVEKDKMVYIWADNNIGIYGVTFEETASSAPTITTDLSSTANVTVGVAQDFSIVATDATSYQWYVGGEAVVGATSASYSYTAGAAGNVEIYCNAINAAGSTKSTVCTVTATMPASAPTITTNLENEYNVVKGSSITLSIVAEGAASYQWYTAVGEIDGATSSSYTVEGGNTIGAFQFYYCRVTNAAGYTDSNNSKVTTVGRPDCELTNVKFSNGAYGSINNPVLAAEGNTIYVPYMAGTSAPTVVESSIVISDGATYGISGNTLTVTAEDGTTNKAFTITTTPITPLEVTADVAATNFTAVPSWVFNPYGYDAEKGLKFAKAVDQESNMRIALGNTRQYYFIGAAKSLTLTKAGTTRKVNVYVNGTKVKSNTNNNELGAIALDESAPCMVMIESNQTDGDGGFASYAIEDFENVPATITSAGWATLYTDKALDFSGTGLTAYTATCSKSVVVLTPVDNVPANTGVVLKGDEGNHKIPVIASSETAKGDLKGSATEATAWNAFDGFNLYVLKSVGANVQFDYANSGSIAAGKAYLKVLNGESYGRSMEVVFDDDILTGINEAKSEVKAPKEGKFFENGRLVIFKKGMKFNANGARIY